MLRVLANMNVPKIAKTTTIITNKTMANVFAMLDDLDTRFFIFCDMLPSPRGILSEKLLDNMSEVCSYFNRFLVYTI
jgi:hypothetical protein